MEKGTGSGVRRVTRDMVARAAGVSGYSVSKAMSGEAGVSEATRERICRIAREMGYRPSPAAQFLASMRSEGEADGRIARLRLSGPAEKSAGEKVEEAELAGVPEYALDQFPSGAMASRVLWNRGIRGLLLTTAMEDGGREVVESFDWSRFAVVQMFRQTELLRGHVVRHSAFEYLTLTLKTVYQRGYRRLGAVLLRSASEEDDYVRLSAITGFNLHYASEDVRCEWRYLDLADGSQRETEKWLKAYEPDCIILFHSGFQHVLLRMGYRFPGTVGLAAIYSEPQNDPDNPAVSGCDPKIAFQRTEALHLLSYLINRGQFGFTRWPVTRVVEPTWFEGTTLARRAPLV